MSTSEPGERDQVNVRAQGRANAMRARANELSWRLQLLVALLLLATLPLAIASVVLPRRVQSTLTQLGENYLTRVADDLAAATQKSMELHVERLRSIAASGDLHKAVSRYNEGGLDQATVMQVNRQLFATIRDADTEVQGIFLGGRDGLSFAGALQTGETEPYRALDVRDRAYLDQTRRTLRPVISDPIRSKIAGVPVVAVCVPFLDNDGRFAGFIVISIRLQHLNEQMVAGKIGATGYPFAIDRNGILVAHPDPARFFGDSLLRQANAARLVARMRAGERGIESYVSSRGEPKIAAFAPVPVCGWSVAASMEIAEFEAPAGQLRRIIFGMIAACVLIALIVGSAFIVGLQRLKLALVESKASETRFRLLANVAGSAIWDCDLETGEVWWNDGLAAFGWRPADASSFAKICALIPPAERAAASAGLQSAVSSGRWEGEHGLTRRDGSIAYVLHRASVVRNAEGRAIRMVGGITDISARRMVEEKNAEQAALLSQTRDGIHVVGLDGTIQYWNPGAEDIYGWLAEEVLGCRCEEVFVADSAAIAEARRAVLAEGRWHGRLQKRNKAGDVLTIDCRHSLLLDGGGQPKSILSIDTDVTERLQVEAKFLRAQRLESIGTLAGGIAHDMNNMLSPILMGVGLLRNSRLSEADARLVVNMEQSANRGTQLVKQLLSFARGVEGAKVPVHTGYVIREIEEIVRSTFPKNITLRCEVARDLRLVRADPTQLNQVLLNLCVNARDAMPTGGHLSIVARNIDLDKAAITHIHNISPGPHILVEVADTGTGISNEAMEKIFEPFFTTKEPGKGTGLGLATVLGIVRGHGGTVSVYSELGKGTVFKIYLPEVVGADAGAAAAPRSLSAIRGQGELILLVDDEASILSVTRQALESHGFRVLIATDGAHAFTLYHRHRQSVSLVLTDMMMPIMDGLALIAALRRMDPDIVVVGSSGLSDHHNQIKAADAGMKHFLIKPYTTSALLEVVGAALNEAASKRRAPPMGAAQPDSAG